MGLRTPTQGAIAVKRPYDAPGWRKLRLFVLERDNYECRVRLPGCTGTAEVADHIQPWLAGGAWLDPLNLRASCVHCNAVRGRQKRVTDPTPLPPSREW